MKEFFIPISKSIANRLLIINYLQGKELSLTNIALETQTLHSLLQKIRKNTEKSYFTGDSAFVTRAIITLLALKGGKYIVDCDLIMRKRPVFPLIDSLRTLGAKITCLNKDNSLPVRIESKGLRGKNIEIMSNISSQFISVLLLVSPYIDGGLTIRHKTTFSEPYLNLTLSMMKHFGAEITTDNNEIKINKTPYNNLTDYEMESDWSAVCFAYEKLCFEQKGTYFIHNLFFNSLQADRIAAEYFRFFGIETQFNNKSITISYNKSLITDKEIHFNMANCPDLFPALCLAALKSKKRVVFTGITNLIYKESNRLESLFEGLKQIGAEIYYDTEVFIINKLKKLETGYDKPIIIKTNSDHRVAMAFYILASIFPNLVIDNTECIKKSFPFFFSNFTVDCL
jgi:3-phosphoshikimate 1-carboxyvinyltransferase